MWQATDKGSGMHLHLPKLLVTLALAVVAAAAVVVRVVMMMLWMGERVGRERVKARQKVGSRCKRNP